MLRSGGIDVQSIVALDLYCTLKLQMICICSSLNNVTRHVLDLFLSMTVLSNKILLCMSVTKHYQHHVQCTKLYLAL